MKTCGVAIGAQDRTRTGTSFRTADFKSAASTNSATRAMGRERANYARKPDILRTSGTPVTLSRHDNSKRQS